MSVPCASGSAMGLHYATWNGDCELVRLILANREVNHIDIDAVDRQGQLHELTSLDEFIAILVPFNECNGH